MNMLLKRLSLLSLLVILHGCDSKTDIPDWHLVYRNDAEGNAVVGNKEELISLVRSGKPIRVGFGGRSSRDTTRSIEHVADVQFLTIQDNQEVFAQISQIIGQAPAREDDGLKIRFRTANKWTTIRGTNGYTTALMVDYLADSLANAPRDNKSGTSWYAYFSKESLNLSTEPLYD